MLRKGQRRRLPRRRQSKNSVRNKNGENRNVRFNMGRFVCVWKQQNCILGEII